MKLEVEVKKLKNLAEELRVDIVEKDTCLDHLQKQNDELKSSLSRSRNEVIREFKMSKVYTDLLDENYVAGFEDFHMDTLESPWVDFNSIKLCTTAESSLLHTSSEHVNIENNASTPHPAKDGPKSRDDVPNGLSQ